MAPSNAYLDQPLLAEIYDHIPGHARLGDVGFYCGLAEQTGGPVLELGCGTGRILLRIARSGIRVTGVDSSGHMLEVCRRNIQRKPKAVQRRINLLQGDMSGFEASGRFRLAIIPFNTFLHLLTAEEQLACLSRVRERLIKDGCLAFDVPVPHIPRILEEGRTEITVARAFRMPDGRRVRITARTLSVDRQTQLLETEMLHYVTQPDGRTECIVAPFTLRYILRHEAERLLSKAGFSVESLLSDFRGTPYGADDPRQLIVVARKR